MRLDVVLHGQGRGAGKGVSAIGVTVYKRDGFPVDGVVDLFVDDGCGNGRIAATQSFSGRHNIGDHIPVFDAEVAACPAKTGDDLIDDHQDIVPVTDLPNERIVVLRRGHTGGGGAEDGFGDKGGDRLAALLFDDSLQFLCTVELAFRVIFTVGAPVGVGRWDMGEIQEVGNIVLAPGRPPGHGEGANRIPVPGLPPRDDSVLSGITGCDMILPGDFHGRLCGFGSSGNEKDPVQVFRREASDPV